MRTTPPNMQNRTVTSAIFTWSGRSGCVEISDIPSIGFNPFNGQSINVVSAKTGLTKQFTVDSSVPGYEDGWDGEACYYISDDGVKIAFFND